MPMLHSLCMMHMFFAAMRTIVDTFGLLNSLFCITILLRRELHRRILKGKVKKTVREKLRMRYDLPDANHKASNAAILSLLAWGDAVDRSSRGEEETVRQRAAARHELVELLQGDWSGDNPLDHFCGPGCCTSKEHAIEKVSNAILLTFLTCLPAVPALNRWNKLYPPICWWAAAAAFAGGIMMNAFIELADKSQLKQQDDFMAGLLDEIVGLGTDDSYQQKVAVRLRKGREFLQLPLTPSKLIVTSVILQPALHVLGRNFNDARFDKSADILPWCLRHRNPAGKVCVRLANLLADMDNDHWLPIHKSRPWEPLHIKMVAKATYRLLGCVWFRCVRPLLFAPWVWAGFIDPSLHVLEKSALAQRLRNCGDCCSNDGFTHALQKRLQGDVRVASDDAFLRFVAASFSACPACNIQTEDRFARTRQHISSANGQSYLPATIGANHALAEFRALHRLANDRFIALNVSSIASMLFSVRCLAGAWVCGVGDGMGVGWGGGWVSVVSGGELRWGGLGWWWWGAKGWLED